tara:strand:- start:398 stop:2263 length:1866 start_codon:yes stop_codon:yes gene_type:complete
MHFKLVDDSLFSQEMIRLVPKHFSATEGVEIRFEHRDEVDGYHFHKNNDHILLQYSHFCEVPHALGDIITMEEIPLDVHKEAPFNFRGIMLDVSRNAAVRVEVLKEKIARFSLLGMNQFCLYTEDMFEIEGEPLFGYARGAYSKVEIRELVDYGRAFGVNLFPCIQTLGHMEQILKYPAYKNLQDNEFIYNVYADGVYEFIAKTIDAACEMYDTNLIHIGLDETHGLGRGYAFKEGEEINPRMIYVDHLKKIVSMCQEKGLQPMMWGDIVIGSTQGESHMKQEEIDSLPKGVLMDYWDYHSCSDETYKRDLKDFQDMGYETLVSPGVWCWSRFFPGYKKAENNISSLLQSAKKMGVRKALNTHWGDDGHECFFDYNIPAHAVFMANCTELRSEDVEATAKAKVRAVFDVGFDDLVLTGEIDCIDGYTGRILPPNIGKCLFYEDPVQALFSGVEEVKPEKEYYAKLSIKFAALQAQGDFADYFEQAKLFCDYLTVKIGLNDQARAAYKGNDKAAMQALIPSFIEARKIMSNFKNLYRKLWLNERKAFGLEVVEGRLATQISRFEYFEQIATAWINDELKQIDELELEHVAFHHGSKEDDEYKWPDHMLHYSQLFSRSQNKWW